MVYSKAKKYKIPKDVKVIKEYAFENVISETVHIPASVKKIEKDAFTRNRYEDSNKNIKNITISKKNKVYAKDGRCIYNKKNKSLVAGIVDANKTLLISEKVEYLDRGYTLINCSSGDRLKKVIFPKNLKYFEEGTMTPFYLTEQKYFTGMKPPKLLNDQESISSLPDRDVYVPEAAYETYLKWYKKHGEYSSGLRLHKVI